MKRQASCIQARTAIIPSKASWLIALMLILLSFGPLSQNILALDPQGYTVEVTAQIQSSPAQITLSWPSDPYAASYRIYRKSINDSSWGNPVGTLTGNATSFTDANVINFAAYEYQIEEPFIDGGTAFGYIYVGLALPFTGPRGKVILIVDNTFSSALATELSQLQQDLVGDGWVVLRHDVGRNDSVGSVKALIRADYNADPVTVKSVFLFGHVPVPYSGDLNPDMHPGHKGAWPADAYYGDMDGNWTDNSVYDDHSEDPRNNNVPGDGKFDQSNLPSTVELEVGRVDLSGLPAFLPKTEKDLLRQYLVKNHRYRHKLFDMPRRALVRDNFGEIDGDAPATDAWRNFTPFFGLSNIRVAQPGEFFPLLSSGGYLWAYGCGGGSMDHADGVGSTTDFARNDPQAVFFILHGSYFGDWDAEDNFLRAALATPSFSLASTWSGLPHWYLHHMALGESIGFSTRLAQNNVDLYKNMTNFSVAQVHISLMGDPTLRMHVAAPPSGLAGTAGSQVVLSWQPSPDAVQGYYVYRADNPAGPYARLNRSIISSPTYTDISPPSGSPTYMVRAIKLESSPSGTYQNPSQGIFTTVSVSGNGSSTVGVVATDSSASEAGDTGTFLITRNGSLNGALTVNFTVLGNAGNGIDYQSIANSVTIPAGTGSTTVTVNPIPDNLVEGDELVILNLTGGNYIIGPENSATVTIHDGPPPNQPPTIDTVPDQNVSVGNTLAPIPIFVHDPDTSLSNLILTASSSNNALVPPGNLVFSGSSGVRFLAITPIAGQSGVAVITVTVSDGTSSASRTFQLQVVIEKILSISGVKAGQPVLRFDGWPGHTYRLEFAPDLSHWSVLSTGPSASSLPIEYTDTEAGGSSTRFYRVIWQ